MCVAHSLPGTLRKTILCSMSTDAHFGLHPQNYDFNIIESLMHLAALEDLLSLLFYSTILESKKSSYEMYSVLEKNRIIFNSTYLRKKERVNWIFPHLSFEIVY